MGEIIPERGPKLKLGSGWKVAIVFFTVFLIVYGGAGWGNMDHGSRGTFIVVAGFTAFGWLVWMFR